MPKQRRKQGSDRITQAEQSKQSKQEIAYQRFFSYSTPQPGADPFAQVSAFDYSIPVTTAPGTSIPTR